jgi:hypothetical protein
VAHAQRLEGSPLPYLGHVLRAADQQVSACALFALEGDRVGLYDVVHGAGSARARPVASAVLANLAMRVDAGRPRGLFAGGPRQPRGALSMYGKRDFSDAYSYHHRALPGVPD